jgi:hypothetical protein
MDPGLRRDDNIPLTQLTPIALVRGIGRTRAAARKAMRLRSAA